MRIQFLQTVEDSHKYVAADENGDPKIAFDVRRFEKDDIVDEEDGGPDWNRRAAGLVKLGYAKEVT